ncbi:MAG TPA: ferredoxin reductase [Thermomicrobiales bacterium]|nr:ferredoxin reductase [Thermomicrobiales bacterium]
MVATAARTRLGWHLATVVETRPESADAATVVFEIPGWPGHRAGQHVDVRLTAEDGYSATRSYSIASPPEEELVAITVESLPDGEVSPYLVEDVLAGDQLELRGPVGGYFVWEAALGGPLQLIGGGSGLVPLMAMLRHHQATGSDELVRLLYSVRTPEDALFGAELDALAAASNNIEVVRTYTRRAPEGWTGHTRRIDADLLREVAYPASEQPLVYVCGPTALVEGVAERLVEQGHDPARVRTERFGPTGR